MLGVVLALLCQVQIRGTLRASVFPAKAMLGAERLTDLYWNTSNPIFRIDNTDHIIDVDYGSLPHQYQQINIYCPYYRRNTRKENLEHHVIYNVGREEFDSCRIRSAQPRIIAYCTQPYQKKIFTLSFRSFSPMPNTLEFQPGQDYYFISTASPGDIHRMVGGYCSSHHMKIVFKVLETESDPGGDTVADSRTEEEVKSKSFPNSSENSLSRSRHRSTHHYQEEEHHKLERTATKPATSGGPELAVTLPPVAVTHTTQIVSVTAVSSVAGGPVCRWFVIIVSLLSVLLNTWTHCKVIAT